MSTVLTIASVLLAGALALIWQRHKDVAATLDARSGDLAKLMRDVRELRAADMEARDAAKREIVQLHAEVAEARQRAETLASELEQVRRTATSSTSKLAVDVASRIDREIEAQSGAFKRALEQTSATMSATIGESEQRLQAFASDVTKSLASRLGENEERLRAIADVTLVPENTPDGAGRDIEALTAKVETLQAKQTADIERERTRLYTYLLNLSTINSSGFLGHRRHLSDAAVRDLTAGYMKALDLPYSKRQLAYIAHKVCLLEDRCVGRLATAIETIIVRLLAARHLVKTQGRLHALEIGTLFGVGAGALYELNRLLTDDIELTLIDPLIGYYGAGEPDLITGEPVSRAALDLNLARIGVPSSRISILQGMSEDPEIRATCASRRFNMLIIDGDHSRAGVKRDFEGYRDLVEDGGLIVFDDYDVKEWPDIKSYVDEEIAGRTDLALVAKGWRTALFRALPKPT